MDLDDNVNDSRSIEVDGNDDAVSTGVDREINEYDANSTAMALETTGVTADNVENEMSLLDEAIADIERDREPISRELATMSEHRTKVAERELTTFKGDNNDNNGKHQ